MNEENFEKWMKALESGEFQQGRGSLYSTASLGFGDPSYCCLGVGCEVAADRTWSVWRNRSLAPLQFIQWLDLPIATYNSHSGNYEIRPGEQAQSYSHWEFDIGPLNATMQSAAGMNDEGKSFTEIAAHLRANRARLVAYR